MRKLLREVVVGKTDHLPLSLALAPAALGPAAAWGRRGGARASLGAQIGEKLPQALLEVGLYPLHFPVVTEFGALGWFVGQ